MQGGGGYRLLQEPGQAPLRAMARAGRCLPHPPDGEDGHISGATALSEGASGEPNYLPRRGDRCQRGLMGGVIYRAWQSELSAARPFRTGLLRPPVRRGACGAKRGDQMRTRAAMRHRRACCLLWQRCPLHIRRHARPYLPRRTTNLPNLHQGVRLAASFISSGDNVMKSFLPKPRVDDNSIMRDIQLYKLDVAH